MLARTLTITLVLYASVAAADPAAEKLFEDGRTALAANQLDAACDAFRRSESLEPRLGTALNLGNCEERRKHVAAAWEAFVEAKALADASGARDAKDAAKDADRRAKALLPRLPYLLLAVTRTDGLQLARDGVTVPEATWDHEIPVDPKAYELTASALHHAGWTKQITLVEGQHLRVEVPALAPEATLEPTTATTDDAAKPPPPVVSAPVETLVTSAAPPPHATYHIGAEAFVGVTTATNEYLGARLIWNALELGPGTVRVVPRFQYTSTDPNDPYHGLKIWGWGGTVEYAYQALPRLMLAGGVGFGIDHLHDDYQMGPGNPDGAVDYDTAIARVAPALVFDRIAIAIGYELERGGNSFHHLFTLGIDCFVW